MSLPELGVGLTWLAGLESAIQTNAALVNVLEIDPQTMLKRDPARNAFVLDEAAVDTLQRQPFAKLVHSLGCPVGGTLPPAKQDVQVLRSIAASLKSPWVSEHLNFHRVKDESGTWHAGILLPPRQTDEGVAVAVASIRAIMRRLPVPLAIETGINYLKPRTDELPDGEFVARIAEGSDCGILLDLQNIWTNARNGRQTVGDYISQLPLERVWELHLAGGYCQQGLWIETPTGTIPEELMELAGRIVPRLCNLKAIVFELFPSYRPGIGAGVLRSQLEVLHRLWERRNHTTVTRRPFRGKVSRTNSVASPREWENTVASLTLHKTCQTPLAAELRQDPGLAVIREMVEKLRGSMVVRTLRLSSRLIMLERGVAFLEQLLATFWRTHPPQPCALDEAEAFAAFLREEKPYVPFLAEVLEYDRAVIAVAFDGKERSIYFGADPLALLRALGAGRRPTEVVTGDFEIRLTPDLVKMETRAMPRIEVMH